MDFIIYFIRGHQAHSTEKKDWNGKPPQGNIKEATAIVSAQHLSPASLQRDKDGGGMYFALVCVL